MVPRTQAEVDALCPKNEAYTFFAYIAIHETVTVQDAAKELQKLYEGNQAMAGEFNIQHESLNNTVQNPMFPVSFTRNVSDDADVVNPLLLAGHNLKYTLRSQFETEFENAVKDTGVKAKLLFLSLPEWIDTGVKAKLLFLSLPDRVFFGVNLGSNSIDPSTAPDSLIGREVTIDVFQYVTWMTGPGEDDYDGGNDFFGTLKGTVTEIKDNGIAVIKPTGFKSNAKDAPFDPDFKTKMKSVGLYDKLTPAGNYEDWYYNLYLEKN